MANYRKVTISISNKELHAMEDFLVCKLSKTEKEKRRKTVLKIWGRLVGQWDSI